MKRIITVLKLLSVNVVVMIWKKFITIWKLLILLFWDRRFTMGMYHQDSKVFYKGVFHISIQVNWPINRLFS
jgi:hypothetical protein